MHAKDSNGDSLLCLAALKDKQDAVKFALDHGLKVGDGTLLVKCEEKSQRVRDLLRDAYEKELARCIFCEEAAARVQFLPCEHRNACAPCSDRWKKCACGAPIVDKVDILAAPKRAKRPAEDHLEENKRLKTENAVLKDGVSEEIRRLTTELGALKEEKSCVICMDREKAVFFTPCGHTACEECGANLLLCHTCRHPIDAKLKIY